MTNNLHGVLAIVGGACIGLAVLAVSAAGAWAQHQGHGTTSTAATTSGTTTTAPAASRKVTMEELHQTGGVPRGWKFALPVGDPAKGRQVFADLECSKCHAIQGESFPKTGGDAKNVGPELTGMGGQHPAEYFAESILSPNAVILDGPGYTGPDGKSIMPTYADSLSVTQLVDLVAFLKSLTAGGHAHEPASVEKTAGDYAVRLEYRGAAGHGADHGGHGGPRPAAAPPRPPLGLPHQRTTRENGSLPSPARADPPPRQPPAPGE